MYSARSYLPFRATMPVQQVRSAPVAAKPHAGPSAADLKTATQLKGHILEVIQRSGGLAGMTQYSQPIDVTRLPK